MGECDCPICRIDNATMTIWTMPFVQESGAEREMVFCEVSDPDQPGRVVFRDGCPMPLDWSPSTQPLEDHPEVVALIDRVDAISEVEYLTRYADTEWGCDYGEVVD
jgi:hypothetical protein